LHDSRQGWSVKDRLTPTIRSVCEQKVPVDLLEKLYRPLGPTGKPLKTVNEMLHWSVVERFGQVGMVSTKDTVASRKRQSYAPKNLKPLFGPAGQPLAATRVWT
jgi:hypothetical protein